jgi:tetratricopeptide (TPR) repeat protein
MIRIKRTVKILTAGIFAASAPIALGEETPSAYVMTVVHDQADGDQVIAGAYNMAIRNITSGTGKGVRKFAAQNNLCVAYAKTNKLPQAAEACSRALLANEPIYAAAYDATSKRDLRAVALSNRGVIHAVSGDAGRAREDFKAAMRLSSALASAAENLAVLEAKTATETLSAVQ